MGQQAEVSWLSFLQAGKMLTAQASAFFITNLAAEDGTEGALTYTAPALQLKKVFWDSS